MKTIKKSSVIFFVMLISTVVNGEKYHAKPKFVFDAKINEWFGTWAMNHDGLVGTLKISESKADCASSPWCAMVVTYTNSNGVKFFGTIEKIDEHFQHMVFSIDFPGNSQKFDIYIFSWDKLKMAGITYWGGRVFGVFATKTLPQK